jgi:hypothetical protein
VLSEGTHRIDTKHEVQTRVVSSFLLCTREGKGSSLCQEMGLLSSRILFLRPSRKKSGMVPQPRLSRLASNS